MFWDSVRRFLSGSRSMRETSTMIQERVLEPGTPEYEQALISIERANSRMNQSLERMGDTIERMSETIEELGIADAVNDALPVEGEVSLSMTDIARLLSEMPAARMTLDQVRAATAEVFAGLPDDSAWQLTGQPSRRTRSWEERWRR